jgi:hypothetical protein
MGIVFEYMVFTRPPNVPFQQATIQALSRASPLRHRIKDKVALLLPE